MGLKLASNRIGSLANFSLPTLKKIHRPIQWAHRLRRQNTQDALPYGERPFDRAVAHTIGPSSLAHAWAEQFTTGPLDELPFLPPEVWPHKSEYTNSDSAELITRPMCWLRPNPHIAQTKTYIIYIFFAFFYSSSSAICIATHCIPSFSIADFQLV